MKFWMAFVVLGCVFVILFGWGSQTVLMAQQKPKQTVLVTHCRLKKGRFKYKITCQPIWNKTHCQAFEQGKCPYHVSHISWVEANKNKIPDIFFDKFYLMNGVVLQKKQIKIIGMKPTHQPSR